MRWLDAKQNFANRDTGARRRAPVMMPAKGSQQLRDCGLDQCMHVSEIVECANMNDDEEYVVKS